MTLSAIVSTTASTAKMTSTSTRSSPAGTSQSAKRPSRPIIRTSRYGLMPLAQDAVKASGSADSMGTFCGPRARFDMMASWQTTRTTPRHSRRGAGCTPACASADRGGRAPTGPRSPACDSCACGGRSRRPDRRTSAPGRGDPRGQPRVGHGPGRRGHEPLVARDRLHEGRGLPAAGRGLLPAHGPDPAAPGRRGGHGVGHWTWPAARCAGGGMLGLYPRAPAHRTIAACTGCTSAS